MTLNLDVEQKLLITRDDLIGESVAMLGIKGSGKSNTCAVVVEEMLIAGVPMTITDIAGEYWGLKEKFQCLVVGKSSHVDLECYPDQGAPLAEFSMRNGVPIILDLSGFRPAERFEFLEGYFERVWELSAELRRPYQIILEEAHNWIPQGEKTSIKETLTLIALEGRKRGLGIIMVSQRSARVEKDVLTQAGILFLHQVRHPADMSVYQDIVPQARKDTKAQVAALQKGQAIVIYREKVVIAQMRLRDTFHGGFTPKMEDQVVAPELKSIDGSMLEQLQQVLQRSAPIHHDNTAVLKRELADALKLVETLTAELTEKDRVIAELKERMNVGVLHVEQVAGMLVAPAPILASVQASPVSEPQPPEIVEITPVDVPAEIPDEPGDVNTYRSPRQIQRAMKKQREDFEALLRTMESHHREMVAFLDGWKSSIKVHVLAEKLGYAPNTILNNAPLGLIEKGILTREKIIGHWWYTGNVRPKLRELFPDLDTDQLVKELIGAAK